MNIGALPGIYGLSRIAYMLGGLLFGIATMRAGILRRKAGALLLHGLQRYAGIPVGLAVAWLGSRSGPKVEGKPRNPRLMS
ncbi:MAG: hypothetical protein ACK2UK_03335 [Candidatus Promineifilaceae bacterium]